MLDLETREETLVARNGNVPTWSADGGSVFFQRNAITVVEHRLDSGEEKVRFSAEAASLPANTHLQTPTVNSANNTLAVTLRKGKRATVTIDKDGKVRKVAGGCQLNWGPDDAYLYYVDHGGHMKNQVYKINPSSFERQAWLDLPGNYSHEYFPRVSPDGTHLVLGACAQGHEHDSADYEIFLWKIGTSADQAARLTFHAGNDCWPDVWLE
jgi:Tol biopolymer transport system component